MKNMKNLTPHIINIYHNGTMVNTIEPEKIIPRIQTKITHIKNIDVNGFDVPLMETQYDKVGNIPTVEKGVYYIVSRLVKTAIPNRFDMIVPLSDIRDTNGMVIGCTGFSY